MDDEGWDALRTEAFPPPALHKFGLVDDMADKAGTQECQQAVAVFRPQEVPRTGRKAAVQPVDAVQALDDADTVSTGAPKPSQIPDSPGEQDCLVRFLGKIGTGLDSTRSQTSRHFRLEGSHATGVGCLWDDANTSHGRIIP